MNNDYFFWEGNPVLINMGEFSLPFPVSIPGIILAIIAFVVLPGYLAGKKSDKSRRKKKRQRRNRDTSSDEHAPELTIWQSAGLLVGSLIVGQLIFLVIPSPTVEQIGPIMVRWYGALFAAAFLTGYFMGRKMFIDAGKSLVLADRLLIYFIVATIVGARLGHVIFYDFEYYIMNIHEVLYLWRGGLASHGAAVGILLALWLFTRNYPEIRFFWLTDRLAIPVILGGAFIRLGNFFNSEIYGLPTEMPWAVVFARIDMLPRHPTMLYEALICLLIFALLGFLYHYYKKQPPEGLLTGVFMVTLFTSRFFVEYTKVEQAPFTETWMFGMGQLLSLPFIIFGIWLLKTKVVRSPKTDAQK